ncbi:hypothetical protein NT04LS_1697 [Listeria seeligeri FSL S4-171]|nr:hypothetical protein NT04LS_1697 [Listeria seeligeri FSL S4-171]
MNVSKNKPTSISNKFIANKFLSKALFSLFYNSKRWKDSKKTLKDIFL